MIESIALAVTLAAITVYIVLQVIRHALHERHKARMRKRWDEFQRADNKDVGP